MSGARSLFYVGTTMIFVLGGQPRVEISADRAGNFPCNHARRAGKASGKQRGLTAGQCVTLLRGSFCFV